MNNLREYKNPLPPEIVNQLKELSRLSKKNIKDIERQMKEFSAKREERKRLKEKGA